MPPVLLTFCFFHRLWECDKIKRGLPSLQICDSQKPWNRRFNDEIQRNYSLDVRPWLYGRTALGCMHVRPKGIRTYDQRLLGRTSIDFLVGNHVTMWLEITKKRVKMRNFLFQIVSKSVRFPNDIMLRKTTFCWLFATLYHLSGVALFYSLFSA